MKRSEEMERKKKIHAERVLTRQERLMLARFRNAIVLLNFEGFAISPETVETVVLASVDKGLEPKLMLTPAGQKTLLSALT